MFVQRAESGRLQGNARHSSHRRRLLGVSVAAAALVAMSGCASLGTNVKGSFACSAPDGICAPTSTIDDQALAMLQGDVPVTPAGPYSALTRTPGLVRAAIGGLARTQDKIVRIVFPPHVDAQGRYHEKTAVHAVVQPGAWSHDVAAVRPATAVELSQVRTMPSLGELAAAAPEVAYPAADAENQVAAVEAIAPDPVVAAAARVRAGRGAVRGRKGRAYRSRSASLIVAPAPIAQAPVSTPVGAAPPRGTAIGTALVPRAPITPDEIRAEVAARLMPRRSAMSPAAVGATTGLALPFAAAAAQLRPAVPAPSGTSALASTSALAVPMTPPKITNSPAFFPVSDAVRNNK